MPKETILDHNMYESILHCITRIGHFSAADMALFTKVLKQKFFEKGEHLLKEGQINRSFHFINSGTAKQFFINENGNEQITDLYLSGQWVLNQHSFITQQPSTSNIIADATLHVFELHVEQLHQLIHEHPVFFQLGKLMEQPHASSKQYDMFHSPEEKYKKLLEQDPEILHHFPLKQIASLLKMSPETLSRIRNKLSKPSITS